VLQAAPAAELGIRRQEARVATISYRCTEDNGLSFELLVNGQSLGTLVGARDTAFPYWIVEDGMPHRPPHGEPPDPEVCIVCVCSCGEYGCGHTQCRVVRDGEEVVFRGFDGDVSAEGSTKEFRFSQANYEAVVAEIVCRAHEQGMRAERGVATDRGPHDGSS
jgi:hypothetical protein